MVRILFTYILPLVLPTVMYLIWAAWVRKQVEANRATLSANADGEAGEITPEEVDPFVIRTPWFRLIAAGVGLVIVSLMLSVFFGPKNPPGSVYQPPRVEDGKVVPGQYVVPQQKP